MQLAQQLYEGVELNGAHTALITYMRTDSVNLSTEAINKIRNDRKTAKQEKMPSKPDENFQTTLAFKVDCFFDDNYIPSADTKFLFYQRLASLNKIEEIEDFKLELKDRFGNPPISAQNLLNTALIKAYAKEIRISAISENDGYVFFQFATDSKLKPDVLRALVAQFKSRMSILSRQRTIKLKLNSATKDNMLPEVISVLKILR